MYYFPAGAEFIPGIHAAMLTFAERALLTAYPFVSGESSKETADYLFSGFSGRPLILDSGIFTLQAKARSGESISEESLRRYFDRYVQFVKDSSYTGALVEVDCHGLLPGWSDLLNQFREVLDKEFGDRVIYCFHPFSGRNDLEELGNRYKRVSVSFPRSREKGVDAVSMMKAAVQKYPVLKERHLHILGGSKKEVFELPNNFSSDSTTWSMIVRYGRAFPNTDFAVTWWRRDKLQAPKLVLETVQEKSKELFENYWKSPEASRTNPEPKYTFALACALVASQFYANTFFRRQPTRKFPVSPEVVQRGKDRDQTGSRRGSAHRTAP